MALRAGRLIQDQNLNVHYNGVSVGGQKKVSKAPKKGGTAGRKPLGDLSNSVNPIQKQAPKKENGHGFSIADKGTITTSKIPVDANRKNSVSNASERVLQNDSRKALSDISNSVKPCMRVTAEKNLNAKRSIVIEEECFLHNHQECIKAQKQAMHMDEFLQMVGLDKGKENLNLSGLTIQMSKSSLWFSLPKTPNFECMFFCLDFSRQSTLSKTPPISNKTKPKSSLKSLEPLEIPGLLIEDQSPLKHNLCSKLVSPSATRTPEPPNHFVHWADHDIVSFRLIETPYVPKH
ncbi:Uncharacterized protein TCM_015229 isoform 4 [Theobroma cacao]|uniref:Uncharacterized protein isoform 4 n=1 Tax=Theobroma cacao TaxID=3641 RepID=A0A061G8C2_THECC|nr:Uncharacterized protein TCM_015229 isoform 4 [Theobroma cacao]